MIDRRHIYIEGTTPDGDTWPTWHTAAWLTVPDNLRRYELQILVHGAGADHRYWDFPVERHSYSYVEWATARGVATINIDRVGSGLSTRPPGRENTVAAQAQNLSQIVAAAREGLPGAPSFSRVVLVGHSLGSVISGYEAATYADVDAVALTGYLPVNADGEIEEEFYDAVFMPVSEAMPHLTGLGDDDYLVSRPGAESLLYRQSKVDPGVVALDQHLQGTLTRGELHGVSSLGTTIRSSSIPTLALCGQHDVLLFDGERDADASDAAKRCAALSPENFDYEVVPDAGHCMNLQRDAHEIFAVLDKWIESQAAAGTRH